jgi:hypothetical protein
MTTGEGFAFFRWTALAPTLRGWHGKPGPGWHCAYCRLYWFNYNPL